MSISITDGKILQLHGSAKFRASRFRLQHASSAFHSAPSPEADFSLSSIDAPRQFLY